MADRDHTNTQAGLQPDGSVYGSQLQAVLLFLVPGLLQGLAVYSLFETIDGAENVAHFVALLMFAMVAPIAHFLTTTAGNRIPALIFSILLGAGTAGLFLVADATFGGLEETGGEVLAASFAANLLICYIAAPFFRTVFERGRRVTHYPSLFEFAWNLPVIGMASFGFTLAVWLVLGIWSALFNLLGIGFFEDLFFHESRALPITLGAFATAIGIVREREGIVLALRNILFALLKVISPILASATLLFVVAALGSGLDALWSGWSATSLMVAAIAAAVLLSNAVIGDEGPTDNIILRWSVRIQSFVLIVLAAFAVYGIYIRLKEYGITVPRFYAAIIVFFAAVYAVAYFFSALRAGSQNFVRQANIFIAGLAFVVAVLVQTPVLNPYRISADDQVARLASGKVAAADFDFGYLRFGLGKEGERALDRLAADESLADRDTVLAEIERVREAEGRYEYNTGREQTEVASMITTAIEEGDLTLVPSGMILPDGLAAYLEGSPWQVRPCADEEDVRCLMLRETGFNTAAPQFILLRTLGDRDLALVLFYPRDDTWQELNSLALSFASAAARDAAFAEAAAGNAGTVITPVRSFQVGGETAVFQVYDRQQQDVLTVPEEAVPAADE